MPYRIWMVDIAREQCPTRDTLFLYAETALEAGYTHLGLYLEHRFAYASAPWATGIGAVTPEMIRALRSEFPSLQIVPFINVLAHVEGFIFTEEGHTFQEQMFKGMQGCPCNPNFVKFCEGLIDDTIDAFDCDLIHIGGDETWQLGQCPKCKALGEGHEDPKAVIYAHHFKPLLDRVVAKGRRPAVWADILLERPSALAAFPKSTVLFDWEYSKGIAETAPKLTSLGFEVVGCPALHVWDAAWFHTKESEHNVRDISSTVRDQDLAGFCLTTWECGLFGAFDTLFPAIKWAGAVASDPDHEATILDAYGSESLEYGRWATMMSADLAALGGVFAYDGIRASLKARFLLFSNPFLAWMYHGSELAGERGDKALAICDHALQIAPGEAQKNVTIFVRAAVEFVRMAEVAHQAYAKKDTEKAVAALAPTRHLFDTLEKVAKQNHERIGGSLADVERARVAKQHVEKVITRIRSYGDGSLGYLPSFQILTNPRFMPHDQASWWLVNHWANE